MTSIKFNVGVLPIGNNPAPGQTEQAIADKLSDDQHEQLHDADLYRDVEITYSQANGWPGNTHTLYSYVQAVLYTIE